MRLGYKVKQSMLLSDVTDDFLKGILLLDFQNKAHVYPSSATSVAASTRQSTYMFTADRETGILSGFSFGYSTSEVCSKKKKKTK